MVTIEYEHPESLDEAENIEGQQGWLVLSPQAQQVVAHTDHDIANADPAFVVEEVIKVVEAARGSPSATD